MLLLRLASEGQNYENKTRVFLIHRIYTSNVHILKYAPLRQFPFTSLLSHESHIHSYSPVIIDTRFPQSPHGDYNQRLVMFNFRGNLSQLPSLYFLLISFTYVTVIKGVHLGFLVAMERTGFYTGAFP